MAARKSGLGRGLDALIPVERPDRGYSDIPVDRVSANPRQPRRSFDEEAIESLAASIREIGLLQPIVVRPGEAKDTYVLIAGERRLRAALSAGLSDVPAIIRSGDSDTDTLAEALVENLQREDLTPLEEAAAYRSLMEDFGMTHEAIGERVGKSRSAVSNTLRLQQLPPAIQSMIETGDLSAGHARALIPLEDAGYAVHIAERAVAEGWSVRQVEEAAQARIERTEDKATRPIVPRPAAIIELEERLAEQLEARVRISVGQRGGKLVVKFGDLDELERIYRQFFG